MNEWEDPDKAEERAAVIARSTERDGPGWGPYFALALAVVVALMVSAISAEASRRDNAESSAAICQVLRPFQIKFIDVLNRLTAPRILGSDAQPDQIAVQEKLNAEAAEFREDALRDLKAVSCGELEEGKQVPVPVPLPPPAKPGAIGVSGERGPVGLVGPSGPSGLMGPVGPPGEVGASIKGDTGAIGPVGARGEPGGPGGPGLQGAPGPRGEPGPPGSAGPAGPAGSVGPTGATGPTPEIIYCTREEGQTFICSPTTTTTTTTAPPPTEP